MSRELTDFERATIDDVIAGRFDAIHARVAAAANGDTMFDTLRALAERAAAVPAITTRIESTIAYGQPPDAVKTELFTLLVFAIRKWDRDTYLDVTACYGEPRVPVPNMIWETVVQHDPAEVDSKIHKEANQLATGEQRHLYWALHLAVFARAALEAAAALAGSPRFLQYVKHYPFKFLGVWEEQEAGKGAERARWTLHELAAAP